MEKQDESKSRKMRKIEPEKTRRKQPIDTRHGGFRPPLQSQLPSQYRAHWRIKMSKTDASQWCHRWLDRSPGR